MACAYDEHKMKPVSPDLGQAAPFENRKANQGKTWVIFNIPINFKYLLEK